MKLSCPECQADILAGDVDLAKSLAKCGGCNNVFSFIDKFPSASETFQDRPEAAMPEGFGISNGPDGFIISRRWFGATTLFMLPFTLFWNGFMVFWYAIAITQKVYIMMFFGGLHLAVGIGLLYGTLASLLNRTFIIIATGTLTIQHRPIPAWGQKTLQTNELDQLYSTENISYGKHGSPHYSYGIHVVLKNGKDILLLQGLPSRQAALYIEQQIEKYLRIRDERVVDEIPR